MQHTMKKALPVSLALLAACGTGKIILNVDIDSFLDEPQRTTSYDVPAVSGPSASFVVVGPEEINLAEGIGGAVAVEDGRLELTMEVRDDSNPGAFTSVDFTVVVRLAASLAELATNLPVMEFDMSFAPGDTVGADEGVDLVEQYQELFENRSLWVQVGVEGAQVTGGSITNRITGDMVATRIHARIVSRDDLF